LLLRAAAGAALVLHGLEQLLLVRRGRHVGVPLGPGDRARRVGLRERAAAGRLFQLAAARGVEVGYFFTGVANNSTFTPPPHLPLLAELVRAVARIPDGRHREAVCDIARLIATARAADDERKQAAERRPT
jgi:hypothetical protein